MKSSKFTFWSSKHLLLKKNYTWKKFEYWIQIEWKCELTNCLYKHLTTCWISWYISQKPIVEARSANLLFTTLIWWYFEYVKILNGIVSVLPDSITQCHYFFFIGLPIVRIRDWTLQTNKLENTIHNFFFKSAN